MRTFIVANDTYIGMEADVSIIEAEDVRDLLVNQMKLIYDEPEEGIEVKKLSDEDLWKAFDNANGDGNCYFVIKELVIDPLKGKAELKRVS